MGKVPALLSSLTDSVTHLLIVSETQLPATGGSSPTLKGLLSGRQNNEGVFGVYVYFFRVSKNSMINAIHLANTQEVSMDSIC